MSKIVLIFDWDDTLMDVGQYLCQSQHKACCDILLQQSTYPFTSSWQQPSLSDLEAYVGHRFAETIIPGIFTEFDENNPQHKTWQQHLLKLFLTNYRAQPKKLFPEITQMLETLKQQGYLLALATNKSRHLLMGDLGAVNLNPKIFDMIVCGDDNAVAGEFKPHPSMINIIQNHFDDASQFIMIGDRKSDIAAAQSSTRKQLTKTIAIAGLENDFNADYTLSKAADITSKTIQSLASIPLN